MIKKVGRDRWQVRVNAGRDRNGKRLYPSKTITGKRPDAEKVERELKNKRDLGTLITESKLTLDQYLDKWLATMKHRLRLVTWEGYKRRLELYVRPTLGPRRLTSLRPSDIESLYAELLDTKLGGGTARNVHALLSGAFRAARKLQIIAFNPMEGVTAPQYKIRKVRALTPEQVARFLEAAKSDEHYLVFLFAIQTGLRPEEYLGLRWKDLELDYKDERGKSRGLAKVTQTVVLNSDGKGWYWSTPKTESGVRNVFFTSQLAQALKAHRVQQNERKLKLGRHYQDNDLVFASRVGTPLRRLNLWRRHFRPILERAGLPLETRLYDLRHTYVTLSLISGADQKTVSEQAGHANVAFTLKVYHHVLPGMREDAADKLERMLFERSGT